MNTVDRRRRLPPTTSFALKFDTQESDNDVETTNKPNASPLFIQLSPIPTAIGSSHLQSGQTIISCSVYAPRPSFTKTFESQAQVKITVHSTPFINITFESSIYSTLETSLNNLILLENYPKSNIDIFVNVLSLGDCSNIELLALIHNATNLAIVDSGIGIKNMPACGISKSGNCLVNCIHSKVFSQNDDETNEELLVLHSISGNLDDLQSAINDARSLRSEFANLCINI